MANKNKNSIKVKGNSQFYINAKKVQSGLIKCQIFFKTNEFEKEQFSGDDISALKKLIKYCKDELKKGSKVKLFIVGRADKRSSYQYNIYLASLRAVTVKKYLDNKLLSLNGYKSGWDATGEKYSGEKLIDDRRVDIYIWKKKLPPPKKSIPIPKPNKIKRPSKIVVFKEQMMNNPDSGAPNAYDKNHVIVEEYSYFDKSANTPYYFKSLSKSGSDWHFHWMKVTLYSWDEHVISWGPPPSALSKTFEAGKKALWFVKGISLPASPYAAPSCLVGRSTSKCRFYPSWGSFLGFWGRAYLPARLRKQKI